MAKRPQVSTLNASTIDILNVIRKNASADYRDMVPEVTKTEDIPRVGDVLFGYPGLCNEFVTSLMNRIAYVIIKSATFYNPYANLKKGFLLTGELVEDIFVNIAKVHAFYNDEPVEKRELGQKDADVKTAFYSKNWRVQYDVSISDELLRPAFTSMDGVQDMINRIIETLYVGERYDEFLLFKYTLIKAVTSGGMYPVNAGNDTKSAAIAFRSYSNLTTFMSTEYNEAGVLNNTPRDRQAIFMDAKFNAQFDVEQLSSAFNMDKTDFFGRLYLIDDWTHFDNKRWEVIRSQGNQVDLVTNEELALMAHVKAIIVDEDWFQFYDNLLQMTNDYVASMLRWNYFLTVFKTIAHSPFANAIVFVDDTADIAVPTTITANVTSIEKASTGTVVTMEIQDEPSKFNGAFPQFVQTQDATEKGIAVHKYGVYIFPPTQTETTPTLLASGKTFTATAALNTATVAVGDEIEFA